MTLVSICRFWKTNSQGCSQLARMPPTLAAATMTTSGFSAAKKRRVARWSVRSSSLRSRTTRFS